MIFFNPGPRRIMNYVGWHLIQRRHILDRELNLKRDIFMQICYSEIATRRKNESRIFFFQCIFFLTSYNGAKQADSIACSLPMAPQNMQRMLLAVITIQKTHGHYIKHSLSSVAYVLSQTDTTMQSFLYVKYLGLIKWNDGVCCLKFISLALWHSLVPRDTETSFSWPIGLI